ncbi:hypothetical protein NB311A_16899 [Nitrobacter sp. Nb-311A]|uniref:ABC transporter C-terminal domain-containing protein n=1 Tax=unclassified Nitrobacter TaxID=2620411 RepID=UPI0000685DFF|nr:MULTISPECIES: ABC transporter C-terminal domain-containing protein [unclassified Nitrobacter]EAQ35191.1 hypothetical protein NB311A_16899 [Nitrobacter sp. Nb-311A]MCB1393952.1 hypothetical protein [Nitrobacter sp.]MCV0386576.1 hypothetical protein [Nitrobacter sp.]
MSDHSSDRAAGERGDKPSETGDESPRVESPKFASEQESSAPSSDAADPVASHIDPTIEAEAGAPAVGTPRIEPAIEPQAPRGDVPRATGKTVIVAPFRREAWDGAANDRNSTAAGGARTSGRFGKGRLAAMAAIAALAVIAGAIGGSLVTSGLGHGTAEQPPSAIAGRTQALEATIERLESEIATLKTSIDRSAKGDAGQFAKVNDRLGKIEKAHADSAARVTKLQEALDKQHASAAPAAPAAPATAAATNVTGSLPVAEPVPLPAPKPGIARLPAVHGWVLHDVMDGNALIEGRSGVYEVQAGDPVPGLGRVDAIRRQDGRWVVVTSRGLITER